MNAALALRLTLVLAAVGVIISSLEYLTCPRLLADNALASWRVNQTSRVWMLSPSVQATLGRLFVYPNFIALLILRLLAAVTVIVGRPPLVIAGIAVIAVTSALLAMRSPYGTDGADQLTLIIFVAASLTAAISTADAWRIFLWFVTAQTCLAYFIAGSAKLSSRVWRDGRALPGILGTTSYGHRGLGPLLSHHRVVSRWSGWTVIILECSFPAVLLGNPVLTYTLLCAAAVFHLTAIFLMRLNTFFWAFLATYPSVIFCTLR